MDEADLKHFLEGYLVHDDEAIDSVSLVHTFNT